MNTRWYIVKRNWPQTAKLRPTYAGVGGEVWPLDSTSDARARSIHLGLMASRRQQQVGRSTELLCLDRAKAEEYYVEVDRQMGGAWLLELGSPMDTSEPVMGFELGFPSGGGSVIESELITEGRRGPPLNDWGLFATESDAVAYLDSRDEEDSELEEADDLEMLAVRVLRHP